ncbi:ribonuclease H1 [Physcia stellaris]|nr:ribonuclease H1 [Physcia stellaris]
MVRPSRLARTARRAHERQQVTARKERLKSGEDGDVFSATDTQEIEEAMRDSHVPCSQRPVRKQSPRSKLRRFLKRNIFQGDILIVPYHVDVARLVDDSNLAVEQKRSVYWTDASEVMNLGCGIGVVYRSPTAPWAELSWSVQASRKTSALEIYAIAKALEIARERCCTMELEQRPNSVCVYSDCFGALEYFLRFGKTLAALRSIPYGEELVGPGLLAAEELSTLNIAVELRYVPGHTGILGNERADRAARRGAEHSVGARKAGKLMTPCAKRGMLGLQAAHAYRPIPWRLHPGTSSAGSG